MGETSIFYQGEGRERLRIDVGSIKLKRRNDVKRRLCMECDDNVSKNPTTTDRGRCVGGLQIGTNVGVQRIYINVRICVIIS